MLEMYKSLHKTPTSEDLNKINEMKSEFYQAIDGFLKKNLEPKGMITPEAVKEFYSPSPNTRKSQAAGMKAEGEP